MSAKPQDPYAVVIPALQGHLGSGVTVGASKRGETGYVWVRLVGGSHRDVVLDSVVVDFLIFGDNRSERMNTAAEIRAYLLAQNYTNGPILAASDVMLPQDMPDPVRDENTITMLTSRVTLKWLS